MKREAVKIKILKKGKMTLEEFVDNINRLYDGNPPERILLYIEKLRAYLPEAIEKWEGMMP